jgi:hypothetical protein
VLDRTTARDGSGSSSAGVDGLDLDCGDLLGDEQSTVDGETRMRAVRAAGHHEIDRRVLGAARCAEELGGGISADRAAAHHEQMSTAGPHGKGDLHVGGEVHVGKQPAESRTAQYAGADQAGRAGRGPTERTAEYEAGRAVGWDVTGEAAIGGHAALDGFHTAPVP